MKAGLLKRLRQECRGIESASDAGCRSWRISPAVVVRQPVGVLRAFVQLAERDIVMMQGEEAERALADYWSCPHEAPYESEGWGVWCRLVRLLFWRERYEWVFSSRVRRSCGFLKANGGQD